MNLVKLRNDDCIVTAKEEAKFIAYKSSIKHWEAPHENEELTPEEVTKLINDIEKRNAPGTVQIIIS